MNVHPVLRKLLTIICEAGLETDVVHDLAMLGAHGYTITDARGRGAHGVRDGAWPPSANIRIEVLCDEATALVIACHLRHRYYENFGMVSYLADVAVLRPEKF